MPSLIKFAISLLALGVTVVLLWYGYDTIGRDYLNNLTDVSETTVFINGAPLAARVADELAEWRLGLSGTEKLDDLEVLLFVFDRNDYHGIWMKDMLIPIDVVWVDENLKIIHIEENVRPESYPAVFEPPQPARFVIEGNAFFARSIGARVGDSVQIPPLALPSDVKLLQ